MSDVVPSRSDRFSFGLWTVGWPARDPFGDPTRPALDPVETVHALAARGAYGVTFHDDDVVPFGSSEGDKPSEWVVFRVTDVATPKLEANSAYEKSIVEIVRSRTADDVFGEYLAWLEDELGTSVNRAALAQALGSSSNAPDTD